VRLKKVDRGHTLGNRIKLRVMRLIMGTQPPDIVRTLLYRPELWGDPMNRITQAVMRGSSAWSVADRELFAAFVSSRNQCVF
jgi:hypothetical protein